MGTKADQLRQLREQQVSGRPKRKSFTPQELKALAAKKPRSSKEKRRAPR
jgi:hypothetical protein